MLQVLFKSKLSSEQIVLNIKTKKKYEYTINYIYDNYYNTVQSLILKMDGRIEDAEDVFQDALAKLIWSIDEGKFQGSSHISTYLITIAKNIWLKTISKNNRIATTEYDSKFHDQLNNKELLDEIPLIDDDMEKSKFFEDLLSKIGDDCQKILKYYYFDKKPYEKIMSLLGAQYSSEQALRNKKSRCIKYLRKGLENRIDNKEELLSIISSCL